MCGEISCLAEVYALRMLFSFLFKVEQPPLMEDNSDLSLFPSLSPQVPAWRRSALPECFSSTLITHNFTVLLIFFNIFVLSQLVCNYPSIDQLWSTHTPWNQLPSLDPGDTVSVFKTRLKLSFVYKAYAEVNTEIPSGTLL